MVLLLLLASLGLGAGAASASVPTAVDDAITNGTVTQFTARNGAATGLPSCGTTCSDLWLAEHRPMPGLPSSSSLWSELETLGEKAGTLPKFGLLGDITLGAGSFTFGWKIGSGINAKWLHFGIQANPSVPALSGTPQVKPVSKGDALAYNVTLAAPQFAPSTGLQFHVGSTYSINQFCASPSVESAWPATHIVGTPAAGWNCVPWAGGSAAPDIPWASFQPMTPATGGPPEDYGSQSVSQTTAAPSTTASAVNTSVADELRNHSSDYPTLIPWLDAHLGGSSTDPSGQIVTIPNCAGLTGAACTALMPSGVTVTTVVLPPASADLTKPADSVVSTSPAAGSHVDTSSGTTTVTVTVNPDPAHYPVTIPLPLPGETYTAYAARLTGAGLVPHRVDLTDATLDPSKGPNAVVRTVPAAGTTALPGDSVDVQTNPATAPDPAAPGSAPTIPALNLDPLKAATPCTSFPFGVPCYVNGILGGLGHTPEAPTIDIDLPFDGHLHVDFAILEPVMTIVRPALVFISLAGIAWMFMAAAMGFGGGKDD